MTALQYMGTGIIFGGFAGVCLVGAIAFFFVTKQKKYYYAGHFRKIKFPEQFYTEFREEYKKTENINETLDYLLTKYPKGKVAKRLRASKDYLKHSHYKDTCQITIQRMSLRKS